MIVKLGNGFSNITWMVNQLYMRGAAAVVLFNRFYAPDIDTKNMSFRIRRGVEFSGRAQKFPSLDRDRIFSGGSD